MLEEFLDKNNESELYHKYYWSKNLKNGLSKKQLRNDKMEQTNYQIKPGFLDINRNVIFEILDAHNVVVPYDKIKYNEIINSLLDTSKQQSSLVLFNHDNFATMAIFIRELYKHADILARNSGKKNDLKNNLHTIVGPTITTQAQILSLQAISNIIKTIPSRDNIPDMEDRFRTIRSNFIKQLITTIKIPNKIILMAPTGTRDVLEWNSDGTINSIIFQNDLGIENTVKMVKSLAESGTRIILVGTNGVGLKRPGVKYIKETDNNRTTSDVYVDIKELKPEECISLIEEQKLMETIGGLVRDGEGNSIAKIVDPIEFDIYKKLPQQIEIQEDKYQNHHFQDSIRKKIVRKLYELLK